MKSVLISIKPKYVALIASGEKTIEVRKTRPKLETPFKCYIYCTIGNGMKGDYLVPSNIQCGKVIGEFVCHEIDEFYVYKNGAVQYWNCHNLEKSCLAYNEISNYVGKGKMGYAWSIYDLKIYDKPKELSEFRTVDLQAVRKCESREQSYFDGYCNNGGCLKCGFYCSKKEDWCDKCKTKPITRPPQSWCYVEGQDER